MSNFEAFFDPQDELPDKQDAPAQKFAGRVTTLGERLAQEAQRITRRRMPHFPWLAPLETAMEQVSALPVPSQARFQRQELPLPRLQVDSTEPPSKLWSAPPLQQNLPMAQTQTWTEERADLAQGQLLSPAVQQQLQAFVGPGVEHIRVHADDIADAVARAQRADAVTIGQHVFFRQDRLRPGDDKGFALLTHEAAHVVQAMQPNIAWRRATRSGIQEEEHEASKLERKALQARLGRELPPLRRSEQEISAAPRMPGAFPASIHTAGKFAPAARPMAAAEDRLVAQKISAEAVAPNMEEIRRTIYRDLMRKMRTDLERGG